MKMGSVISIVFTAGATVVSGMVLFFLQRFLTRQQKKEEQRDAVKTKETVLLFQSLKALGKLSVANSIALRDGVPVDLTAKEYDILELLIKNLLTLSQLDSKTMNFNVREFDLEESVAYLAKSLAVNASARGHKLTFDGAYDPVIIRGDKIRIEQILINITSNAIKYTPDGGRISLRLQDLGDRAEVTVTDNGVGIPEEDIPHLFERFYRVEKARSSDKGGTGLGLAIAKEFAAAHGGDIRVSSIVGKGTTFTVTLPKQGKL